MVSNDIVRALGFIDPDCDYDTWLKVGMALHAAGADWQDWDDWSRQSATKYHDGECLKKWHSFSQTEGITEASLYYVAKEYGWHPEDEILDWDSVITEEKPPEVRKALPRVDTTSVAQFRNYITALFKPSDKVSYCLDAFYDEKDGKWKPGKNQITGRPVSAILKVLDNGGTIEEAIGTPNKEAGAWIRFNPVSGEVTESGGIKDAFVTDYRYALVESDSLSVEDQYATLKNMQLPIAALVNSGGKSLHAIVKINAKSEAEYKRRVKHLYEACERHGLIVDKNDKNPSRLSRLPGVPRGDRMQELIPIDWGCSSFEEWQIKDADPNDTLPLIRDWWDIKDNLAPLEEEVIPGVLRQGHKMMVAAASKAGKSFLMVELAVALATGSEWLGFKCRQSKVLYVNFEIAAASFEHRVADMVKAYGAEPPRNNLMIWNLRGKSMGMSSRPGTKEIPAIMGFDDKLINRTKLYKEAYNGGFDVIIIDPIYKVLEGDENSAKDIRAFCNSLDKVCEMTNCCAIYVHHHSKGKKADVAAIDRSSGSGVFGRDADAIIDLMELQVPQATRDRRLSDDLRKCKGFVMSTELREFPPTAPKYVWFKHPMHIEDTTGILEMAAGQKEGTGETESTKQGKASAKLERTDEFMNAREYLESYYGREPTIKELSAYLNWSEKTVKNYYDDNGIDRNHKAGRKPIGKSEKTLI